MPNLIDEAIAAARDSDREQFGKTCDTMASQGWEEYKRQIAERYVSEARKAIPDGCSMDDLISVAQRSFGYTSSFLNVTVYDLEFIMRGYRGASQLISSYTLDIVLPVSLALTGVWTREDWAN